MRRRSGRSRQVEVWNQGDRSQIDGRKAKENINNIIYYDLNCKYKRIFLSIKYKYKFEFEFVVAKIEIT